jgi:branched-chain amino acid transport system substrate-binding protein
MNTNKLQVFVFAMLFVVGAFTGCVGDDDDKKETTTTEDGTTVTTHKIGFLNPITGPLEPDAAGFKWGADEAAKDLNALYADDNVQFEIVELDSGCSGDVAGPAAQTLVDSGVVAVVGAACSGASMGANAVLAAAGIPMISYASTNPGLSDASAYPHFYRVVPSDAIQGPAGADMMADAGVTNEV